MNLKETGKKLKENLPIVYLVFKNSSTPLFSKILAGITIGYALSPIDLIPDFIPVLGYLDDLIILPALVALTVRCIPKEVFDRNKEKAKNLWVDGKPKKWYFAVPIILFWGIILFAILRLILK